MTARYVGSRPVVCDPSDPSSASTIPPVITIGCRSLTMTNAVDGKDYQFITQNSLPERLLIRGRDHIYTDFVAQINSRDLDSIIDVGVSDIINDGANVLERKYPFLEQITACGLGEATAFREAFARCAYHRIVPHALLPFDDQTFEIAATNAVQEHVGTFEKQKFFIEELCRVSKKVFISVPHRYFPIEHHTTVPLLHYNDTTFRLACKLMGHSEWYEEVNLVLMTRTKLKQLTAGLRRHLAIGHTGLKLGPLTSNPYLSMG